MDLSTSDRLCKVIYEGQWQWPVTTDIDCLTILHSLPAIHGDTDKIIWLLDGGNFSTAGAYIVFSPPEPKVDWSSLLLGRFKIPHHNFILWLAFLGRLSTMDKHGLEMGQECVSYVEETRLNPTPICSSNAPLHENASGQSDGDAVSIAKSGMEHGHFLGSSEVARATYGEYGISGSFGLTCVPALGGMKPSGFSATVPQFLFAWDFSGRGCSSTHY
ncbi:UNVERIFIED_CONTAM: hypothetical protein Slati_3733900 [Sesamum latifolium]|uniref:Reverse transcriptase zinc-binding domain-containing protein n=1 Tax=Sesamum latifolium TaxID=2727402 RepID=A0AAW2U487_9LAMI